MTGNVVPLPERHLPRLEIWAGWRHDDRRLCFFLSHFDEVDAEIIVWDGADYVRAMLAVSEWRRDDPGIRIIDRSGEVL